MSQVIPVRRPGGQARRPKRTRRASAGLSPLRAGAALLMVVAVLVGYGVTASSVFAFRTLEVEDAAVQRIVTDDVIAQQLGLTRGTTNLFLVWTDRLEASLRQLPAVTSADVAIRLPDTVQVHVVERVPILVWIVGAHRYLVDRDGTIFADVGTAGGDQAGAGSASAGTLGADLPAVVDDRAAAASLAVGGQLDPVDLDAATRLGSLRPGDVGSRAAALRLSVDDEDGFTMRPSSGPWTAVFGFYTPNLRPPSMIPGQVQSLRSLLLDQGEAAVRRVTLATGTGGTYLPRATPKPGPSDGQSAVP